MICVVGFDSPSVRVLQAMLAEGRLETLAGLIERGNHRELETPAVDFAAGAFHSLYSGRELGDHGLFYPFQFAPGENRVRYATAFDAPETAWERLARSGLRSLVLDPYEGRPPATWNGEVISGVGFRDRVVLPRWARPAAAGRAVPRGPQATEVFGRPGDRELLRLRERLVSAPGRVADAAERLLAAGGYDLAWITLCASHLAGHQFWDLSQLGSEPARDERRALQSALGDVYEATDVALGRIVAALPDGADVIVASAVGMDENTSRADLLPEMLRRVLSGGAPSVEDEAGAGAVWRLRAAVPASARRAVANALPDRLALELTARMELRGADLATAPAFAHPADNQGYVRLNVAGREATGVLAPDAADDLCDEIEAGLRTFTDPDGSPAVVSIVRVKDLYPGERSDRLPDLAVRWSERSATTLTHVTSERFGRVSRAGAGSGRSGNHTAGDAWAVVAPGTSRHVASDREPRVVDVAATVAAVTGADPDGLAGKTLLER